MCWTLFSSVGPSEILNREISQLYGEIIQDFRRFQIVQILPRMVLQIFGRHRAEPAFLSCRPGAGRRAERRAPVGERRRLRAQGHVPGAEGPEGLTRKRRGQKAGGGGFLYFCI
ncbi:unnamed protein product [Nesidiocoris tenuis]|uniref:Uncharacterized protein n=1 Tax=Nesidiocoris tenuis TaxID=355587 RepID=A0A6H5HQH7_9HEMI|nr:unnamed protein product [Nesidiocoris tenuis]